MQTGEREPGASGAPYDLLLGPTGTGKSELGVALAARLGAEVLSLDSMLVYRGMDVGTAKPGAALRARVPHHLLDLVEPSERYDLSRYLADAGRALEDVRSRGKRALFVGGTALYAKALLFGVFEGPSHDPVLRAALDARSASEGAPSLHAELARRDPESARRLHPNDRKRIVRALEVLEASGRPLSEWQREWRGPEGAPARAAPHRLAVLELEPALHERQLAERTERMLADGWIDEVRAILGGGGFGPTAIQALGYRDVARHLAGELDRAALAERVRLVTRQFARRQRTWLRGFATRKTVDASSPGALEALAAHFDGAPG